MDDLRAALGNRVKSLRVEHGWTQEQLAERADLDYTYISGIERGRRSPGLNTLAQLAKALGISLPALVAELRPHKPTPSKRGRPPKRR